MDVYRPPRCLIQLLAILLVLSEVRSEPLVNGTCMSANKTQCQPGILIPIWKPVGNLAVGDKVVRAFVYFLTLLYMFLGVSIISDRFMSAIEVITSQEKEITVKMKSGEKQVISVRIWNETVSNLTLMALGSSAPEILLSIIEICGKGFEAGDLGPGTIVGSAAYNLFVIIGLCVVIIPNGQTRRIKHLSVFFVTAAWSVFAYLWMYMIIAIISPGRVEVWEALLTFSFFPLTVITAYLADTKIFFNNFLKKKFTARGLKAIPAVDLEMQGNQVEEVEFRGDELNPEGGEAAEVSEFEKHRMEYINALREIRKKHPNIDAKTLEEMAQIEVLNRGPKSRAFYRMQATRQLTGSGNVIKKSKVERRLSVEMIKAELIDTTVQRIFFDPGHYTVMENVGTFAVTVSRAGGDLETSVKVNYTTEDGTANAGDDYEATSGTLLFEPGEAHKQIYLTINDDDVFEEDEHFYMRLSDPQVGPGVSADTQLSLVDPSVATIMILDDDHAGLFHFQEEDISVSESAGEVEIKVARSSGARGVVLLPYKTSDGTATGHGKDYEDAFGYLEFQNDQTEGIIRVRIIDDNEYEKNETFFIEIEEPRLMKKTETAMSIFHPRESIAVDHRGQALPTISETDAFGNDQQIAGIEEVRQRTISVEEMGRPRLGKCVRAEIHIIESLEFKNTVDHLLRMGKWSLMVGTSSWKEQFIEAITVNAGDGGGNGADHGDGCAAEEMDKLPTCMDYAMHFLTIFWKVLFAFVPPTDYVGGWVCFVVSIMVIGLLTAFIGDIASGFGCTVGLTDAVTAITFVALGTSLPDTFASKVAAINDDYADSSVGNVTGSNAVNVFLGIGVAWSIAAIYHAVKGTPFTVSPGSLGFSVTLFCILALFAISVMLLRRRPSIGGELGGPRRFKLLTGAFFGFLWVFYLILSSLENFCHIEGF